MLVSSAIYVSWLDYKLLDRFNGRIWTLPARVYARPLELFEGKQISTQQLLDELENLNYASTNEPPTQPGSYHHWNNHFEIRTRDFRFWDGNEKGRGFRLDVTAGVVTGLYDLYTSKPVSLVRFDPAYVTGIFPAHGEDRLLLKLDDVPQDFRAMLVMTEDRRFYDHFGIDLRAIARALLANIRAGGAVQGGSTITQQLVKNLFLSPDRNLWRKFNEAVMALLLELQFDKGTILETYMNEIYLGQDRERAIHGFGLASDFYFGKPLHELGMDQMAMLVGMVKGASYYSPVNNPERAKRRRDLVLQTSAELGLISAAQSNRLQQKPLQVINRRKRERYPAFIDLVKRQLKQYYDADDLKSEGLQIFTTLDPLLQNAAEHAVSSTVPGLSRYGNDLQTALIAVSPDSGEVLAAIGDSTPAFAGYNRVLDAHRQIGSLIKPVIYLAALKQSHRYTLASILEDSRLRVMGEDKKIWQPENYDKIFHGNVLLYQAFEKSFNIPAARVGLDIGLADIIGTLRELGSDSTPPPYPSITLGAIDMSPFEVAGIYQTFAANGFHSPLRSVRAVLDRNGDPLQRYALDVNRQVDAGAIALVNHVLHRVTVEGTAAKLKDELDIDVAGKTGTSDDLRDSWFAGFSGDTMAVVWLGYDDNRPTGLTGSSGAMRVWSKLFQTLPGKSWRQTLPDNVELQWIDAESGLLSRQGCKNAVELPFIRGSEPDKFASCDKTSPMDWLKNIFSE
jgi:penicillin-binding protein 1B